GSIGTARSAQRLPPSKCRERVVLRRGAGSKGRLASPTIADWHIAPGNERGYDAVTPRRLHRGAPSKSTTPGKRRIFHVARPVPIGHLPRLRARLRAHRRGGAGANARRSRRPALLP